MKPSVLYTARASDGALIAVSPALEDAFGLDPRECVTDSGWWWSHLHPDDRTRAAAGRALALESGRAVFEYRLEVRAGSYARVRDEIETMRIDGEVLLHGFWTRLEPIARGASDRRRGEASSNEEVRLLFEVSSVGNAFLRLDGTVVRANAAFRRFLGRESEEVLGTPLFDFLHPDDVAAFRAPLEALVAGRRPHLRTEVRFARLGGWVVWADASVVLLRGADGAPRELLLHTIDVTDQRLALELLRVNEKRLATALADAQQGLWDWDLATDTVYFSPTWKSTLGYREEELENNITTLWKVLHPDDRDATRALVKQYLDGQSEKYEARFRLRHKSGHYVSILSRGTVLRDPLDGKPSHFVGTHMDLTELELRESTLRKARDAAEAANRAKSVFLANMSHELRTPLNSVIGFSELLGQELPDERQRGYARSILDSGKHLLAVLNDIIDISAIEAGKAQLRLERLSLAVVIDSTRAAFERAAFRAGVSLAVELEPGLPTLSLDPQRMKQVLSNLLSNAIKFTPRGGRVVVSVRASGPDVRLEVTDSGIGIKEADLPRIFGDFEQLDSGSQRSKLEGTGLGLGLVRRLVEMHGGKISVASTEGKGSVFTVTLPVVPGS